MTHWHANITFSFFRFWFLFSRPSQHPSSVMVVKYSLMFKCNFGYYVIKSDAIEISKHFILKRKLDIFYRTFELNSETISKKAMAEWHKTSQNKQVVIIASFLLITLNYTNSRPTSSIQSNWGKMFPALISETWLHRGVLVTMTRTVYTFEKVSRTQKLYLGLYMNICSAKIVCNWLSI